MPSFMDIVEADQFKREINNRDDKAWAQSMSDCIQVLGRDKPDLDVVVRHLERLRKILVGTYTYEDEAKARRYVTMVASDVHRGVMDTAQIPDPSMGISRSMPGYLLIKADDMKRLGSAIRTEVCVAGEPVKPKDPPDA